MTTETLLRQQKKTAEDTSRDERRWVKMTHFISWVLYHTWQTLTHHLHNVCSRFLFNPQVFLTRQWRRKVSVCEGEKRWCICVLMWAFYHRYVIITLPHAANSQEPNDLTFTEAPSTREHKPVCSHSVSFGHDEHWTSNIKAKSNSCITFLSSTSLTSIWLTNTIN